MRIRSNQDSLNFPIKVNRAANLLSMSERGDGRSGSGMEEVFGVMVVRLEGGLGELEGVMREVEAFLEGGPSEVGGVSLRDVGVSDREDEGGQHEVVEGNEGLRGDGIVKGVVWDSFPKGSEE